MYNISALVPITNQIIPFIIPTAAFQHFNNTKTRKIRVENT